MQTCEDILKEHFEYCEEKQIYPKWLTLAREILKRRHEMSDVYWDVYKQVGDDKRATYGFIDALQCTVCAWSPADNSQMRSARSRLQSINEQITDKAEELALLLQERSNIENKNSISSDTHYHIASVIERASTENYLFNSWVKDELAQLRSRYDMKYWPSLHDVMLEISDDASNATVSTNDTITSAALQSSRSSLSDFCRALFERVLGEAQQPHHLLPIDFHLKDATWATLINVLLGLPPEKIIDAEYIKGVRQRERAQQNANRGGT